jgi:hypothetical protein
VHRHALCAGVVHGRRFSDRRLSPRLHGRCAPATGDGTNRTLDDFLARMRETRSGPA